MTRGRRSGRRWEMEKCGRKGKGGGGGGGEMVKCRRKGGK